MPDTGGIDVGGMFMNTFGLNNASIGTILIWVGISIFIVGGIIAAIIFIYYRRQYNQKIVLFGMIGNRPTRKATYRGKFQVISSAGDRVMRIMKPNKTIPCPTIQAGSREWWFWERKDGEWINFGLGELDEVMQKAGAYFIDFDMRMQRLGIEKNLRDRLQKEGFWKKYGTLIMGAVIFILIVIALIVLFTKLVDVAKALTETASAIRDMAASVRDFYINKVGSGVTPVGGT